MDADPAKHRMPRTSLHPLTLEEALKQIAGFKVEPKPQKGGRKKKAPESPQEEAA